MFDVKAQQSRNEEYFPHPHPHNQLVRAYQSAIQKKVHSKLPATFKPRTSWANHQNVSTSNPHFNLRVYREIDVCSMRIVHAKVRWHVIWTNYIVVQDIHLQSTSSLRPLNHSSRMILSYSTHSLQESIVASNYFFVLPLVFATK